MSRDPRRLKVFWLADELVLAIYRSTRTFPVEERFGLQAQIRRAAVSVSTNIVEGCARRTLRDYLHFMWVAVASASEVRYLIDLARRLGIMDNAEADELAGRYGDLTRALQTLIGTLEQRTRGLRPEA
jgi:four helix bundle protein